MPPGRPASGEVKCVLFVDRRLNFHSLETRDRGIVVEILSFSFAVVLFVVT